MQTIGITGGTGFIGGHLAASLVKKGYHVIIFTRSGHKNTTHGISYAHWEPYKRECDILSIKKLDAVVNLAGAGIADKRLTTKRKKEIIDSRVKGTGFLVEKLRKHNKGCKTFVSASAIGYYGADKGGAPFTETAPPCNDFLGNVCQQWEEAASQAGDFLRTVIVRTGIVLGKDGGAYPKLARPLSFAIKPILGGGRQVVSWISVDDLVGIYITALEQKTMTGPYNAVAPSPLSHAQLMHAIASTRRGIHIPAPTPAWVLKLTLGEVANEMLKSCTVSPQKILDAGYKFHYPDIKQTVAMLAKK